MTTAPVTKTAKVNGKDAEIFEVSFGNGRKVEVRRLTMGDQFTLAELMPEGVSRLWTSLALLAASVWTIDGHPARPIATKRDIRSILDLLGEDGVEAANAALAPEDAPSSTDGEAAFKAVVGNFSETEGSAK